jgi:hypothetical protein
MTIAVKVDHKTKVARVNGTIKVVNSKIRGVDVDTSRFRYNELPVEAPNGTLKVFTLPNSESYVSGLLEVFLDGLKQILTTDYAETSATTFTFVNAPDSDEVIVINYIKA